MNPKQTGTPPPSEPGSQQSMPEEAKAGMNKKISGQFAFAKTNVQSLITRSITRVRSLRRTDYETATIILLGLVSAVLIRYSFLDFKTLDYHASLKPWYDTIKSMGFSAFGTDFSTYNPPYLYLLYLIARFLPNVPTVIAVKTPSLIADFIMAYFVYRIVQIKYPNGRLSLAAGMATLFAPTVILNSAFWGQADSLFTAGLVACLFFLLTQKHGWAMVAFGIALAFKLQAIFLAPLLLALLMRGTIHWKYFLIIPAILILALVPSWIAGRPIRNLIDIYLYQTSQFESLTMNAPSLYAWLPDTKKVFNLFYIPGVITGAVSAYLFFLVVYKSPRKIIQASLTELTLLAMLIIPFFLPKMHERYFYPADVISIILAFYFPKFFYMPVLVGGVSFFAYQPYLFNIQQIPLPILTGTLLVVICILGWHAVTYLYSTSVENNADIHTELPIEPETPAAAGNA